MASRAHTFGTKDHFRVMKSGFRSRYNYSDFINLDGDRIGTGNQS